MKTQATVTRIEGRFAIVESERTSACEGCHKGADGGCSVCSLMGSDRKISTKAKNTVGAAVGDRVMIESDSGRLLWYAALVFLFPILSALLCWGISALCDASEIWQFAAGAAGFIGAFAGVFCYSGYLKKNRCDVEIVEIIRA